MNDNEMLEYRAHQCEIRAEAIRLGRERLELDGAARRESIEREAEWLEAAVELRSGRSVEMDDLLVFRTAVLSAPEMSTGSTSSATEMAGVFAPIGEWAEILNPAEGHFREVVRAGAFRGQLARQETPQLLFEHGLDPTVAKKPLGKIGRWAEEPHGGIFAAALVDAPYVRDVAALARSGLLGASMGMRVEKDAWSVPARATSANPDRLPERQLLRVHVAEISCTARPAYRATSVSVRSADGWLPAETTNVTGGVASSFFTALAAYLKVPSETIDLHELADGVAIFSITGTQGLQRAVFSYDPALDVVPRPVSAPNPVTIESVAAFSGLSSGRSAAADARKKTIRQMYVQKNARRKR